MSRKPLLKEKHGLFLLSRKMVCPADSYRVLEIRDCDCLNGSILGKDGSLTPYHATVFYYLKKLLHLCLACLTPTTRVVVKTVLSRMDEGNGYAVLWMGRVRIATNKKLHIIPYLVNLFAFILRKNTESDTLLVNTELISGGIFLQREHFVDELKEFCHQ